LSLVKEVLVRFISQGGATQGIKNLEVIGESLKALLNLSYDDIICEGLIMAGIETDL
jgi:hypothetical protein